MSSLDGSHSFVAADETDKHKTTLDSMQSNAK